MQLLADLEEAEQEAARAAVVPRGTIRLTTSVNFGVRHLAPAIAEFLARHAEVRFDVSLSDRVIDLIEEGFDLAVRIGTTGSENVVARKLGETRLVPCASPQYLSAHPPPKTPEDLAAHNCFTYEYVTPRNVWRFRDASGAERAVRIGRHAAFEQRRPARRGRARLRHRVRAGFHRRAGSARRAPRSPAAGVHAAAGADLRRLSEPQAPSAKVRTFVEFLVARFEDSQDWSAA